MSPRERTELDLSDFIEIQFSSQFIFRVSKVQLIRSKNRKLLFSPKKIVVFEKVVYVEIIVFSNLTQLNPLT